MNHDYAHCADFKETCPTDCFRAQLVRDLKKFVVDDFFCKDADPCKAESGLAREKAREKGDDE